MKNYGKRLCMIAIESVIAGFTYTSGIALFNYVRTKMEEKKHIKQPIGFRV